MSSATRARVRRCCWPGDKGGNCEEVGTDTFGMLTYCPVHLVEVERIRAELLADYEKRPRAKYDAHAPKEGRLSYSERAHLFETMRTATALFLAGIGAR